MDKYYKSKRAFDTLSKLPSFVTNRTDSSFFNLINTYNIELDTLNKDIISSSLNIIPSTFNTNLASSIYSMTALSDLEIVASGFTEKSLYDFTYSAPTNYLPVRTLEKITSYTYVDTHFVSPFYYENTEGESVKLNDALIGLRDEDSWFDQRIDVIDINKVLTGNIIKNGDFSEYSGSATYVDWANWEELTSINATIEWDHDQEEQAATASITSYGANAISYASRFVQYLDFGDYKEGETYRFSCEIKTDKATPYISKQWFNIKGWANNSPHSDTTYSIGDDWTRCEFDLLIPQDTDVQPYLVIEFGHALSEDFYDPVEGLKVWVKNVISTKLDFVDQIEHNFLVDSQELPKLYQNLESSEEDEWITLDSNNKFSPKELFFTNLSIIHAYSQTTLTEGSHYNFTDLAKTEIEVYEPFASKELVVEYSYSPMVTLKSFSYLKEYHSILRNEKGSLDIFYLTPSEATTYTRLVPHSSEIAVIKGKEISAGTSLSGIVDITKSFSNTYTSMNVDSHNSVDIYLQLIPLTFDTNITLTHLTLFDPAGVVPEVNIPSYETNPLANIYYYISGSGANESINIISPNTHYTNFGIKIHYSKNIVIENEACTDTGLTYEVDGATYKYLTLPSISSEKDWFYIEDSLLSSSLLNTEELEIHNSISSYSLPVHLEEEYFLTNPIFSITENSILERYSLNGDLQDRLSLNSDRTYISVRIYGDFIILLNKTKGTDTCYLTSYDINTLEQEDEVLLSGVPSTVYSFSYTDNNQLYLFSTINNGLYISVYDTYYGCYTIVTDDSSSKTVWFREDPTEYDTVEYVTENVLDHWGRVLGAERWPKEILKNYMNRLSNIASSNSNSNKQGIINGGSAMLNLDPYMVDTKTVYSLSHPLTEVDREVNVYTHTNTDTGLISSYILLPAAVEDIADITFTPAIEVAETSTFMLGDDNLVAFHSQSIETDQGITITLIPEECILFWDISVGTTTLPETVYNVKYLPQTKSETSSGNELLGDPEFDTAVEGGETGTYWGLQSGTGVFKISGGVLICVSTGGLNCTAQNVTIVAGVTYKIELTITQWTWGDIVPYVGGTAGIKINSNGTHIQYITAGYPVAPVLTCTATLTVENISVKEVIPQQAASFSVGEPGLINYTAFFNTTENHNALTTGLDRVSYWVKNLNIESQYYNEFMYFEEDIIFEKAEIPTTKQLKLKTAADTIEYINGKYDISATYKTAIDEASRHLQYKWDSFYWDKYKWIDGESIHSGIPTVFDGATYKIGSCSDTSYINQSDCIIAGETWISFDGGDQQTNDLHSMKFTLGEYLRINSLNFNTNAGEWNSVAWWQKLDIGGGHSEMPVTMAGNPSAYTAISGSNYLIGYNTGNGEIFGVSDPKSEWENIWRHCVLVWKVNSNSNDTAITSADVEFYVDGVSRTLGYESTAQNSNGCETSNTAAVTIGGTDYSFNGLISDVAFYNSRLLSGQVTEIMQIGSNKTILTTASNLLAWYKMGDGSLDSNTVVTDITDYSFDSAILSEEFTDNNNSGWSFSAEGAVIFEDEAAHINIDSGGDFVYINKSVSYTADTVYRVTFDAKSTLDGYVIRVADHNNELGELGYTNSKGRVALTTEWKTYSILWKTNASSDIIGFSRDDDPPSSLIFSITNISIEPLNGAPAVRENSSNYILSPYRSDFPIVNAVAQFGFRAGAFSKALTIHDNTDTLKVNSGYFCIEDKEFYLYPTTPTQELLLDADAVDGGQILQNYPSGTDSVIAKLHEQSILVGHEGADALNNIAGGCIIGDHGFAAGISVAQHTEVDQTFSFGVGAFVFSTDPLFTESYEVLAVSIDSIEQDIADTSMSVGYDGDTNVVITGAVDSGSTALTGDYNVVLSYKYSTGDYTTYTTLEECTSSGLCIDTSRSSYIESPLIDSDFEVVNNSYLNGVLNSVDSFKRIGDGAATYGTTTDFAQNDTLATSTYAPSHIAGGWLISVTDVKYNNVMLIEDTDYEVDASNGEITFLIAQSGSNAIVYFVYTNTTLEVNTSSALNDSRDLKIVTTSPTYLTFTSGGVIHDVGVDLTEGHTYKLTFNYKVDTSYSDSPVYYKWGTANYGSSNISGIGGTIIQTLDNSNGATSSTVSEILCMESGLAYFILYSETKMSIQIDSIRFQRIADVVAEGISEDGCTIYENALNTSTEWVPYQWVTPSIDLFETMDGPNIKQTYDAINTKYGYLRQIHDLAKYSTYTGDDSDILDIINNTESISDTHYYYINNDEDSKPILHSSVPARNVLVTYGVGDTKIHDTGLLLDNTVNLSNKVIGVAGFMETVDTIKVSTDKPFFTSSDTKLTIVAEVLGTKKEYIAGATVNIKNKDYLTGIDGRVTAIIDISNYGTSDETLEVTATMNNLTINNTIIIKYLGDL